MKSVLPHEVTLRQIIPNVVNGGRGNARFGRFPGHIPASPSISFHNDQAKRPCALDADTFTRVYFARWLSLPSSSNPRVLRDPLAVRRKSIQ